MAYSRAKIVETNIKSRLVEKRTNVTEMAKTLELSSQSVYQKLKGQRDWKLEELIKVSKFLKCDVTELLLKRR